MEETFIGSAGSLMAAVLETVGYYYQSFILDHMSMPFQSSIGGLLYTVAGIITVLSFAVYGNFRFGLWMLLGPSLFLAMIIPRTETNGAGWIFANIQQDQAQVDRQVQNVIGEYGVGGAVDPDNLNRPIDEPARVSALFGVFSRMVSQTTQSITEVLVSEKRGVNHHFIMRAELFASLFSSRVDDSDFRELLHLAFLRGCRQVVEQGRKLYSETTPFENLVDERQEFRRRYTWNRVELTDGAIRYIAALKASYGGIAIERKVAQVTGIQQTNLYMRDSEEPSAIGRLAS